MIHERQLVSATLWDLRAHYEEKLRALGVAQRAVDAWRATPTPEQRAAALGVLQTQVQRLTQANEEATTLLAELTRIITQFAAGPPTSAT
jgi:HAMP domain-containing protein